MDEYNFWQDFFDTYQSLSDGLKFAWLIVPPVFLLALVALIMWYRLIKTHKEKITDRKLIYSIESDSKGQVNIYRHKRKIVFPVGTIMPLLIDERDSQDQNIGK